MADVELFKGDRKVRVSDSMPGAIEQWEAKGYVREEPEGGYVEPVVELDLTGFNAKQLLAMVRNANLEIGKKPTRADAELVLTTAFVEAGRPDGWLEALISAQAPIPHDQVAPPVRSETAGDVVDHESIASSAAELAFDHNKATEVAEE